jgi:ubiquinone/menaquinone biosynthesis C-methylase UbiE
MQDAEEVYRSHAEQYDELVRCEDRDGNLLRAIQDRVALSGCDVIEFGAGTGRLTRLLAPHVSSIRAFDVAPAMLDVARARVAQRNVQFELADNASVPVADGCAQLAIAGWSYGHQTVWHERGWREPIERAIREMLRVLAPGGAAIVIETLGTGHVTPFDPPTALAAYYAMLENTCGFTRGWIRTDYEFASPADAERLVGFFFGEQAARALHGRRTLAECTGLWTRQPNTAVRIDSEPASKPVIG